MDAPRTDKDRGEAEWESITQREMVGGSLKRRREPYKSKGVRKKLMMERETEWEIHEEQKAVMGKSLICKWDCPWWPFSPPVRSFFFPSQTSMLRWTQVSIPGLRECWQWKTERLEGVGPRETLSYFPLSHVVTSHHLALKPYKTSEVWEGTLFNKKSLRERELKAQKYIRAIKY